MRSTEKCADGTYAPPRARRNLAHLSTQRTSITSGKYVDADVEHVFFDVVGDTIWGATARILTDLLARILRTA